MTCCSVVYDSQDNEYFSPTPKLSSRLSSERRTLWRHFWSYCRVTKSLPSLFCYARWSSSWKWRETSRTFLAHGDGGPSQRLDYKAKTAFSRCLSTELQQSVHHTATAAAAAAAAAVAARCRDWISLSLGRNLSGAGTRLVWRFIYLLWCPKKTIRILYEET